MGDIERAFKAGFWAGFNSSGEGFNAEWPFADNARDPHGDAKLLRDIQCAFLDFEKNNQTTVDTNPPSRQE